MNTHQPLPGEAIRDKLVPTRSIPAETRKRLSPYDNKSVSFTQVAEFEADGWFVDAELKTKARLRREKTHDVAFEDRVWATLARLQFTHLNRDRTFKLAYGDAENERQQIDVFAADEQVALLVECKSTETTRPGQFKREIEALAGQKAGLVRRLRQEFPGIKVKFLLATNNYTVSREIGERLKAAEIFHMTEDSVDYFLGLADHLGAAAKYQLLGALFAGEKIPNLDSEIPAIRGTMGGHQYYSFAIQPDRLLRMSYVLHRNQANSEMMPTYQRLIKKSRLKKVADFVDKEHGFFPNSVIVNIETGRRGGLRFDPAGKADGPAKIGMLHLPQTYRAAFIIDGQHRLYGYAQSERATKDLIPVVAFVNLERSEQVSLFMQINENQQAVPKNLRNTLNSDLLWNSKDANERARALRLRVAQHLGDQRTSPLFDRVIVGEDLKTTTRCITIDAISNGLLRGDFIGSFKKSGATSVGSFYAGDNQSTFDRLTPFLELAFEFLRDELPIQWALGSAEGGFVFMNNGVEALLRLLSDIVTQNQEDEDLKPLQSTAKETFDACREYLGPLVEHLRGLSVEEASQYRKMYGSGGGTRYYRRLQLAVREAQPSFRADGLDEWIAAQDKEMIRQAIEIVTDVEAFLKTDIRERLENEFHNKWDRLGIPRKVREAAGQRAISKNLDLEPEDEVEPWDCLFLLDYEAILLQDHELWVSRFEKRYTRPGDEQISWKKRTSWITELNTIRNNTHHSRGVNETEFAFLTELRAWLLDDEVENEFV